MPERTFAQRMARRAARGGEPSTQHVRSLMLGIALLSPTYDDPFRDSLPEFVCHDIHAP